MAFKYKETEITKQLIDKIDTKNNAILKLLKLKCEKIERARPKSSFLPKSTDVRIKSTQKHIIIENKVNNASIRPRQKTLLQKDMGDSK